MGVGWPAARWALGLVISAFMGFEGIRKKSLNRRGALAAFLVGVVSLGISLRLGLTLILFYKSSSVLTKYRTDVKRKLTGDFKEGGQRGAAQVLSCSLFGTFLAVARRILSGEGDGRVNFAAAPLGSSLLCAYLGFYACCTGDTWSSELGVLSKSPPRLITNLFQVVPPGTNGGVSVLGTVAAAAGGLLMGTGLATMGWLFRVPPPAPEGVEGSAGENPSQMPLLILGMLSGLMGSFLDSLLGATLQVSCFDRERKCVVERPGAENARPCPEPLELVCGRDLLTNEQVNMVSAVATSIFAGLLGGHFF